MAVVVNLKNPEEEKVLIAFLESLNYDYLTTSDVPELTHDQQQEVLLREKAFAEGKTSSRSWEEIKKELERVYS